jgi:3-isopropylmalate dehydrogenase
MCSRNGSRCTSTSAGGCTEAVKAATAACERFGRRIEFQGLPWGADYYLQTGVTVPAGGYDLLRQFDAVLIGALGDPRVADNRHARDILLGTRFELDLYVNYRPVRLLDVRLCPLKERSAADVNFAVFRENTEGLYVGAGGRLNPGTPEDALWQRVFRELALQYPAIDARHLYIDALALLMVQDPSQLDVIVTNNLFGDIITDIGAALQGGLGLAASHPGRTSMFEPVHGSAPPLAGKNIANPMGAVLSAALMLRHLGAAREADVIEEAVRGAVVGGHGTPDIGGHLGTRETGDFIVHAIRSAVDRKAAS